MIKVERAWIDLSGVIAYKTGRFTHSSSDMYFITPTGTYNIFLAISLTVAKYYTFLGDSADKRLMIESLNIPKTIIEDYRELLPDKVVVYQGVENLKDLELEFLNNSFDKIVEDSDA